MAQRGGKREGSGRKKGLASIKAEEARNLLAQMVFDEITPIGEILIRKAKKGDIMAVKELFDRAFGKAPQAVTGADGKDLKIIFDAVFNNGSPS